MNNEEKSNKASQLKELFEKDLERLLVRHRATRKTIASRYGDETYFIFGGLLCKDLEIDEVVDGCINRAAHIQQDLATRGRINNVEVDPALGGPYFNDGIYLT